MSTPTGGSVATPRPFLTAVAWAWVIVPFGYGLYQLLIKIPALFGS
ncbi:MAG TPA: hypothetical protein VN748_04305 [Pseudonocardiaceae bacterium]|jgi:hypothetical protein|nr:hypothetical protein [Pseudonocardiaceae bacterium]